MQRRHFLCRSALLAAASLPTVPAWAQPGAVFPTRPITLLVPYGAGGPTDTHVRAVAEAAGKLLGQPVVIDNKPGANGVNGAALLPKAVPDGYTLAILPASVYREPHVQKTPFDPRNSFSYIAMLSDYAFGLAVRADAPWKQWKDLAADAKKRPGRINIGATGAVGTPRIVMDEATSALDEGQEYALYRTMRERLPDCIVVSVSHRPTLEQHHDQRLELLGDGAWRLQPV